MISTSCIRNRKEHSQGYEVLEEFTGNEKQIDSDYYSILYLYDTGIDETAGLEDAYLQIKRTTSETNSKLKFKLAKRKILRTDEKEDLTILNSIQFMDVKSEDKICHPLRLYEWKDMLFYNRYCFLVDESKTSTQIGNDEWMIKDFTIEKLPPDGYYSIREMNDASASTVSKTLFNITLSKEPHLMRTGFLVNHNELRSPIFILDIVGELSNIKVSSMLRFIQHCYDLQTDGMDFHKQLCAVHSSFFRNDYFEKKKLKEPKLLFPLFHLFALRDMKFESIEILEKIGEQADKIWSYLIELPSDSLKDMIKYENMWNESLREAEENGILQHSLVFILRNQIRNRSVHELAIRHLLTDLGISCSALKNNEMFMDVILLSNLIFNWNKYGK